MDQTKINAMNKKFNNMSYRAASTIRKFFQSVGMQLLLCCILLTTVNAQNPEVTVRFANPTYDCGEESFCIDVEFQADSDSVQLYGFNIYFMIDSSVLKFDAFTDLASGYSTFTPDPPTETGLLNGEDLVGFDNVLHINGAIIYNSNFLNPATELFISTTDWTRIYSICFDVVDSDPFDPDGNFSPSLVWDMTEDNDGGIHIGTGIVMTKVDTDGVNPGGVPVDEASIPFNWEYIPGGDGTTGNPYGSRQLPILSFSPKWISHSMG